MNIPQILHSSGALALVDSQSSKKSQINSLVPASPTTSTASPPTFGSRTRDSKRLNFSTPQTFVDVVVGKDVELKFTIHENVICYYSDFFNKAFNSNLTEGLTKTMRLEDVAGSDFGYFVNWLYTQKLETTTGKPLRLIEHAKLWVLAKRFMVEKLAETTLQLVEVMLPDDIEGGGNTLQDFQAFAYEKSEYQPKDTPLKQFAIRKTIRYITSSNKKEVIASFPEGMLLEFTEALVDRCYGVREMLGEGDNFDKMGLEGDKFKNPSSDTDHMVQINAIQQLINYTRN